MTSSSVPVTPHGRLVVVNQYDHSVDVVDLATRKVLGKVTVGINGHEVVASKDGKFAYVPIYSNVVVGQKGTNGDHVDIVDLQKLEVTGHIELGKGVRPHRALIGPNGLLYVTAELDKSLYAVDLKSNKVVGQIPSGQDQTHMFVITKDGHRAYTSNISDGSVSVLDLRQHRLLMIIPVAKHIQRISISPDGHTVFTHDQEAPRIAMIDTRTDKLAGWIDVPTVVFASEPTPDGKHLLALSSGGNAIYVLDLKTKDVVKTLAAPASPMSVEITPDGKLAYVTCIGAGKIAVIDLASWELLPSIDLEPGVDGLAWVR